MDDQRHVGQKYGSAEQLVIGWLIHGGSFLLGADYGRCRGQKKKPPAVSWRTQGATSKGWNGV